jgi:hypothetical protein
LRQFRPFRDLRRVQVRDARSGHDLLTQAADTNSSGAYDELINVSVFRSNACGRDSILAKSLRLLYFRPAVIIRCIRADQFTTTVGGAAAACFPTTGSNIAKCLPSGAIS